MSVQEEKLTAIADAIREADGTTDPITADDFPDRIKAIQPGVKSFNGRTGEVVPQEGDYTAEQVGALPITGGMVTGEVSIKPNASLPNSYVSLGYAQHTDSSSGRISIFGPNTENILKLIRPYNAKYINITKNITSTDNSNERVIIRGVATPTGESDAANKKYVDDTTAKYLPISGGIITGNLTLKGSGNFGNKINFGDSDFVHISEPTDDCLEVKAKKVNFVLSDTSDSKFTVNGSNPFGGGGTWKFTKIYSERVLSGVTSQTIDINSAPGLYYMNMSTGQSYYSTSGLVYVTRDDSNLYYATINGRIASSNWVAITLYAKSTSSMQLMVNSDAKPSTNYPYVDLYRVTI